MSCLDENLVVEYLQGSLSAQRRQQVEQHLDHCNSCLALVSETARVISPAGSPAPARLGPGTRVAQFAVIRLLGGGAMGQVYLCRDTRLGRRVALKMIKGEALHQQPGRGLTEKLHGSAQPRETLEQAGEAVQRFLREARTTARFAHPHIVTIHDVGRWQGRPYLALEYLEGQTLAQRMEQERQSVRETMRIGLAMAGALREAHLHGVLHRDLKPSNVMLPRDGRLRVLDFGLAKVSPVAQLRATEGRPDGAAEAHHDGPVCTSATLEALREDEGLSREGMLLGTPLYMAPEQWRAEACSAATDVWALGMVCYEMLAGHPFEGLDMAGLCQRVTADEPVPALAGSEPIPAELRELIAGCLHRHADRRPTAEQVCAALERLLHPGRDGSRRERNPFRGLLPFAERHAELFFGREGEVAAFVEQLREQPLLPVVGPSGVGKTSFVQAGVIPRLREQASWLVLGLRPGERPFLALAQRLMRGESSGGSGRPGAPGAEDPARLARQLACSPMKLNLLLRELAQKQRCRVLLVVDQLEELCTGGLAADPAGRVAFMRSLCCAADDPDDPVRVIFTLRDDFLGRLAVGTGVRAAMGQLTILHSPEPEELRQTISGPLAVVGYRFDDEQLPARMVQEVQGEFTALPLLQFATALMWERRDRDQRRLLRSVHETIGGVAGALARHADHLLEGLSEPEVDLARQMLLRLVNPNLTRRSLARSALLEGLPGAAQAVLDRLVQGRLLALRKSFGAPEAEPRELTGDARLELVHESLLSHWGRLAQWIDESKEELTFLSEVGQAAEVWDRRGRPAQEVWRGPALQEALLRAGRVTTGLPGQIQAFLKAGQQRQMLLDRRRVRRLALGGTLLVLVAAASVLMSLSLAAQRKKTAAQRDRARLQRAAAQREGAQAALAQQLLPQARAKLRSSLQTEDSALGRALWLRLKRSPMLWHKRTGGVILDAAFSPDGKLVAAASLDRSVYLVDVRSTRMRVLRGHRDQVYCVVFSRDGRTLYSGSLDGQIRSWDLRSGTGRLRWTHPTVVQHLTLAPDGRSMAAAGWDSVVRLWNVHQGHDARVRQLRGHSARLVRVEFGPRGRLLASASMDGTIRLWDPRRGTAVRVLRGHKVRVTDLAWTADGRLISRGKDNTVRLWRTDRDQPVRTLATPGRGLHGLAVSPDGKRVASAGWSQNAIRVWDLDGPASGPGTLHLLGHRDRVASLAFSPNGRQLVSGGIDKVLRLWRSSAPAGLRRQGRGRGGHQGMVFNLAFSADGRLLATGGQDRQIHLWEVRTGRSLRVLRGHQGLVTGLAFSPDGRSFASADLTRAVLLWNVADWTRTRRLSGHRAGVFHLDFSPDSTLLASSSGDRTVRVWDVATGLPRRVLGGHGDSVSGVTFSADGRSLASASYDHKVRIWDTTSWGKPRVLSQGSAVYSVSFSPDGRTLAAGSVNHVRLWDLQSGRGEVLVPHPGRVHMVHFDPRGERLAVACSRGMVRIWNLDDRSHQDLRGHHSEVNAARFSPDGRKAASVSDDGTVRTWEVAEARPHWRTVALLHGPSRVLNHLGWQPMAGGSRHNSSRLDQRLQQRARRAAAPNAPRQLCVLTNSGSLELWRGEAVTVLEKASAMARVDELVALPRGCLVQSGARVLLHGASGKVKQVHARAQAVAPDRQGFLVASEDGVLLYDADGRQRARYMGAVGVTALTRGDTFLALGFKEGNIELVPLSGPVLAPPVRRPRFLFENVPASAVSRLRQGPRGTLVAGFANGQWGIWSSANGKQFLLDKLHGSISQLEIRDRALHVTSSLGQHQRLDLEVFHLPYCELMRRIWASVPAVWEDGLARMRPPPGDHHCYRQ